MLSVCILFFRLIWFLRCERLSNDSPQGRWDQINIKQRYGLFIEHGRGIRFEQHCKILITLKLSIFNDFSVCGQRSVLWWIIRWSVAMEIKMKLCYYSLYRAQFCFYLLFFIFTYWLYQKYNHVLTTDVPTSNVKFHSWYIKEICLLPVSKKNQKG